jgi:ComF family protein
MPGRIPHFLRFSGLAGLAQYLLPHQCALCQQPCRTALCQYCQQRYLPAPGSVTRCLQCALPLAPAADCHHCQQQEPAYDHTVVAVDYGAPFDHLIWALKFGHQLQHAPLFAHLMRDALLQARHMQALPTLLLPVPLSRLRLQQRGFNQALEIARPLAHSIGIRLLPKALARTRDTRAQSQLHIRERANNVQGAFALLADPHEIAGQHVALVDDVMTTGATLNELAHLLKRFGASQVSNLIFARTPPPDANPANPANPDNPANSAASGYTCAF